MSARRGRSLNTNMSEAGTSCGTRPGLVYDGLDPAVQELLQRRPLHAHKTELQRLLKPVMQQFLKINKYPFRAGDNKTQLASYILEMVSKSQVSTAASGVCANRTKGSPTGVPEDLTRTLPRESVQLLQEMEQRPQEDLEALLLNYGVETLCSGSHANLLQQLANLLSEQARAEHGMNVRRDSGPSAKRQRVSSECCVCMEQNVSAGFSPCGHAITCMDCASKLQICPLCRKNIDSVLHLFFA